MKTILTLLMLAALGAFDAPAVAQARAAQAQTGTLRVIVRDPSGAVIPNAVVVLKGTEPATQDVLVPAATSDGQGVATALKVPAGRYAVSVTFPGFESRTVNDVRVRAGDNRREVTLPIERVAESVSVGRDAATAASDPKSERFSNVLSKDQIEALPDDPDEMERMLQEMAGPGATIRVDGFRGGKLPPKSQIRSIRFASAMFSADNHSAGHTFVDIGTQPGLGPLRGGMDVSFRDGALNSRNAFQSAKGPEQTQQYNLNLSGTLKKDRTSFSLSAGGASLYDSAYIFAAVPGRSLNAAVRRPSDRMNFNLRVDHALNKSHTLRGSFQQNDNDLRNLGVGSFDLEDRAFTRTSSDSVLRLSESGPLGRLWFAESRLQVRRASNASISGFEAPTVRVLDAFTSGGAQQAGGRRSTDIEYATDIDFAKRGHALRMGTLIEGGVYRSDNRTNYLGTYTFPSLADYNAGRPATYSRRTGNPLVEYSQWQGAFYLQDDWRARKNLTLNVGLRQEFQTNLDDRWNLAPRGGLTWSPFKNGKTTIRGGGGLFYEWLEAETFEQTLRVDGTRQQDLVIVNPGYPDPLSGGVAQQVLPPGRYMLADDLIMPKRALGLVALTQQILPSFGVNMSYSRTNGWDRFRGRNVNAPLPSTTLGTGPSTTLGTGPSTALGTGPSTTLGTGNGVRPDPALGNVIEVESTAKLRVDQVNVGLNFSYPKRRLFLFANYSFNRQYSDADGAFSLPANSYDLAAEWGRVTGVPRHIASAVLNTNITKALRIAVSTSARAGAPYNITTGRDDNGDTVFNDRPAGVGRNTLTAHSVWDVAARLTYAFGFGEKPPSAGGPGGQMIMIRAGGGAGDLLGALSGGGAENKRIRFELFASASNLLNNVNPMGYSGVMTSPFFRQPTAAGAARKIDVGMRIGF